MASRVGKYLLFETLGEGAFGKVKLGVHEESGEQVAVKIMDKSDIKAQEMTMNVRREIAIMKALKHRNIVNLRQVLTSQSKLYIVMDLVTGGELFNEILKGKLEESVARRYFQQLVDGIEYCHRRGVCHRDLKPENLLIDETTGELKITDFGLSAMKGASTTEELLHTQCGSPNYCAPEIIARHKQGYSGNKVDAWSCGIILFALLAGFLPFYDENTKELYRMIQRDDVKFPRKFPPDAKDLVLRLLYKDPERRYTLSEVKKHRWFAVDYDGDDASPKSLNIGSSPQGSRRKRRGHSRKSSVDQAPRSKDFAPRRKSDKSDSDSGVQNVARPLPPVPPLVSHPVPPPVAMDTFSRNVPVSQRPPAPPSVTPPKPRSPLPPLPVPPPTTSNVPTVHSPTPGSGSGGVLPPPPPPTVVPPSMSTPGSLSLPRPVPPYPTAGIVRRNSRETREMEPNGPTPSVSNVSVPASSVTNSVSGGGAVPPYSALSETPPVSSNPIPPPFPAPVIDKLPSGADEQPMTEVGTVVSRPSPEDSDESPPATFAVPTPDGSTVVRAPSSSYRSVVDTTASNPCTLDTLMSNGVGRVDGIDDSSSASAELLAPDHVASKLSESPEQTIQFVSASESPRPETESFAVEKIENSPKSFGSKWKVSGKVPPPSYSASTMAPVTTPPLFAAGDSSWLKAQNCDMSKRERSVGFVFDKRDETDSSIGQKPAAEVEDKVISRPLSIVERRQMLFNKLASESTVPPPIPDQSLRSSSYRLEPNLSPKSEPKSAPTSRFSDRDEKPLLAKYPASDVGCASQPLSASDFPVEDAVGHGDAERWPPGRISPAAEAEAVENDGNSTSPLFLSTPPFHVADGSMVTAPAGDRKASGVRVGEFSEEVDEAVREEGLADHIGNTNGVVSLGAGIAVLEEDESIAVPLKRRLTAALARYHRIFKLGNNIGITSSPSFSSNRGSHLTDTGSGGEAGKEGASAHAKFFARAKAVTGAWGIILTQELENDSDSEEEAEQVTEAELKAFSRLLDFWDNRRASARVPKDGEVVLDDDQASPLSEEDIVQIQSLIQKLEPKQVEEVTDVGDDDTKGKEDEDESASDVKKGQIAPLDDLDVEELDVIGTTANETPEASVSADLAPNVPIVDGLGDSHDMLPAVGAEDPSRVRVLPPPSPLPLPPPYIDVSKFIPSPSPPAPPRLVASNTAAWDRSDGPERMLTSVPPPLPPPPASLPMFRPLGPSSTKPSDLATPAVAPPSPPPPPRSGGDRSADALGINAPAAPLAPPSSVCAAPDSAEAGVDNRRMVVTQSTVRDPFRPRSQTPQSATQPSGNGHSVTFDDPRVSEAKVAIEVSAAVERGARAPERLSHDTEGSMRNQRKSSTNTSDVDVAPKRTMSKDSGRGTSATSITPRESGGGGSKSSHARSPSRDEHATRGMFTFGMLRRRRSSALTSFDSELAPDKCLTELGRILISMHCVVHMKKDESKMKCEAPVRHEKLLLSITCSQERKISTVLFKRGRKDKSHVDGKEFFDFFQSVQSRFHERVRSDGRRN